MLSPLLYVVMLGFVSVCLCLFIANVLTARIPHFHIGVRVCFLCLFVCCYVCLSASRAGLFGLFVCQCFSNHLYAPGVLDSLMARS